MEKEFIVFNFIITVINSCNEMCQLECCLILIDSYFTKYNSITSKEFLLITYNRKLSELNL